MKINWKLYYSEDVGLTKVGHQHLWGNDFSPVRYQAIEWETLNYSQFMLMNKLQSIVKENV